MAIRGEESLLQVADSRNLLRGTFQGLLQQVRPRDQLQPI